MFCLLNFTCLTDLRFLIELNVCYDLTRTDGAGAAADCVTRASSKWRQALQLAAQMAPDAALFNVQTTLSLHNCDDMHAALAAGYTAWPEDWEIISSTCSRI